MDAKGDFIIVFGEVTARGLDGGDDDELLALPTALEGLDGFLNSSDFIVRTSVLARCPLRARLLVCDRCISPGHTRIMDHIMESRGSR